MIGIFAFPTLLPKFFGLWGLTHTEAGWINGIYFAGYTVAVPLLASLTDRIDAKRIYVGFMLVSAVSACCFALFANGFWSALIFRSFAGIGLAGTFIPGLKALIDRLKGKHLERGISYYTATFSLGTGASFFITGTADSLMGWRWAFFFGTVGALLSCGIAAIILVPKTPARNDHSLFQLFHFRPILSNTHAMGYAAAYGAHMWELFSFRSWVVAFLAFCLQSQTSTREVMTPSTVAAVTSLVAMWASIGGAELASRYGRRKIVTLIMSGSALIACFMGFITNWSYPIVVLAVMLYALFVQGDSAALHTGVIKMAHATHVGATMAVQSLLGFACAFLGPLAVGIVLDATGGGMSATSWGAAFVTMGAGVAVGPLAIAIFTKKKFSLP